MVHKLSTKRKIGQKKLQIVKKVTFPPFKYKKQCHDIKIVDSFQIFIVQKCLFRDLNLSNQSDDTCSQNQIN